MHGPSFIGTVLVCLSISAGLSTFLLFFAGATQRTWPQSRENQRERRGDAAGLRGGLCHHGWDDTSALGSYYIVAILIIYWTTLCYIIYIYIYIYIYIMV